MRISSSVGSGFSASSALAESTIPACRIRIAPRRIGERGRHRIELTAVGQPFDGGDLGIADLAGEHQAGIDRLAIDQHRAGAALAHAAGVLGAGQGRDRSRSTSTRKAAGVTVTRRSLPLTRNRSVCIFEFPPAPFSAGSEFSALRGLHQTSGRRGPPARDTASDYRNTGISSFAIRSTLSSVFSGGKGMKTISSAPASIMA